MRPAFGEWDEEANDRFKDLTWDKKLVAKVKYRYGRVNVLYRKLSNPTKSYTTWNIPTVRELSNPGQFIVACRLGVGQPVHVVKEKSFIPDFLSTSRRASS